ncbi:hypothetical protein GCM10008955_21930 [Deinococcus malanensis]|uniref:CMP/dCMP-type deaminase domain-containing protein n=1 Tax=Deinococcus malanensis TaxID=1706855 RepID=A0ABQ2EW64_9DEIO|nr:nucleoside deaminase [Deinococcus malanensis]GGK27767.1 hypothetical protein GCM10008955_21930 [Deinococcus malanensis]
MTGVATTGPVTEVISAGWHVALSEAWEAYLHGSYPIGACVVDQTGHVLAWGRNRLGEPRRVEAGVISGHDLAHAEINALLALADMPRPECYGWTVLTTVQPCPQCAGAIAMSGVRAVEYAAPDPWAGCTRLLTEDSYVSRKAIRVGRAPAIVQVVALRLALVGFLEEGHSSLESSLMRSYRQTHPGDLEVATRFHRSGALQALREERAPVNEALTLLEAGA